MFAIFRLFSALSAVVAFIQSPTGKKLIGQVRSFITNRMNRRKSAQTPVLPTGGAA